MSRISDEIKGLSDDELQRELNRTAPLACMAAKLDLIDSDVEQKHSYCEAEFLRRRVQAKKESTWRRMQARRDL